MYILLEIPAQIVALINKGKSCHSVTLQYNPAHGMMNDMYR